MNRVSDLPCATKIETDWSSTLFIQRRASMAKREKQKRYSLEFREMAVRRMKLGDNVSQLSRELGVDRTCLYHWKRKHDRRPYSRVALPEPGWRDKRIETLEAKIRRGL